MTDSMPPLNEESTAAPAATETNDGPWLAVLVGVALLLALFLLLALIAA